MTLKRVIAIILCIFTVVPFLCVGANAAVLPFTDVPSNNWAYKGVSFMYDRGYMAGTSKTLFAPAQPMTRAMFVTVLAAMAGVKPDNSKATKFTDVPAGTYYTGAVKWANENGIVAGVTASEFGANQYLTREQAAVMIRTFGTYMNYDVTYEDETLLTLCYDAAKIGAYAVSAVRWALDYGLMSNCGDMDFCPKKALTRAEAAVILMNFAGYEELPPIVPPVTYTVKFVNYNGALLYTTTVAKGSAAKYRGSTPTKPEDANYTYTFAGWNTAFTNITSDITVTAKFTAKEKPKPKPIPPKPQEYDIRNDKFGSFLSYNNTTFRMSNGLFQRLNDTLYASGGRTVGFYVVDLGSKMTFGYNAQKDFRTACTVKAGFALYAYKQIEAGKASFNDIWTYKEKHYVERSGTIQFSPFGTKYRAEDVLYNMIHISDNVAYYMAQDYLGYQGYNKYITSLGVEHIHWGYNTWGYLTPHELGLIWQEIYKYRTQSSYGAKLFDIFLNAKFNFIKEGLYGKYPVAHKSGWNDYVYNDAAIVFGERPYIMVIMTTPGNFDGNQAYLGKIARLLDEYMKEYTAWYKTHN